MLSWKESLIHIVIAVEDGGRRLLELVAYLIFLLGVKLFLKILKLDANDCDHCQNWNAAMFSLSIVFLTSFQKFGREWYTNAIGWQQIPMAPFSLILHQLRWNLNFSTVSFWPRCRSHIRVIRTTDVWEYEFALCVSLCQTIELCSDEHWFDSSQVCTL